MTRTRAAAGTLALASLPYWLPGAVVALRMRIFTLVNGEEAVAIPGQTVDAAHFEEVYAHPAANGRSRGSGRAERQTRTHGPRFGIERVWEAEEASANRRSTSRVAAQIATGAMPRAGHGRLPATPNGMKAASLCDRSSQRSGRNASGSS